MTDLRLMIDINSDIGEGFPFDLELMKYVSSVNICCGLHAGSIDVMKTTISASIKAGIAAGAHPGYPDRDNFGRIDPGLDDKETVDVVVEQMCLFDKAIREAGSRTAHMKLHGALYNKAAASPFLMYEIVKTVVSVVGKIPVFSLAGSASIQAITDGGGIPVSEAFADRAYEPDGTLMSRKLKGAVITDYRIVAERVFMLALGNPGGFLPSHADSVCIHGDTKGALLMAAAIKKKLMEEGIAVARRF
ncbi:MAG: LamB/YcsF family protein [Clostridia bacterium]|nr:LamB/YcsF family protein [Clostridia bacterium]MBN2883288.1 LamB/YcsF family protein [Clostridia bacterium]